MTGSDLVLHFVWPPPTGNDDMRTVRVKQVSAEGGEETELYKFHHPVTGSITGVTTFQRKNFAVDRWENAGQIEWVNNYNGTVYFGVERVNIRELRRQKKTSSLSRRFKAGGNEYKWKITSDGADMVCVSSRGKNVATWTQETQTLRISERVENVLDRMVVTCVLNLWLKQINLW